MLADKEAHSRVGANAGIVGFIAVRLAIVKMGGSERVGRIVGELSSLILRVHLTGCLGCDVVRCRRRGGV